MRSPALLPSLGTLGGRGCRGLRRRLGRRWFLGGLGAGGRGRLLRLGLRSRRKFLAVDATVCIISRISGFGLALRLLRLRGLSARLRLSPLTGSTFSASAFRAGGDQA